MTKIFYFTSALSNEDYKEYLSFWNVPPNLSNQNFHNKFIRCLALSNPVEVISVRPINSNFKVKTLQESSRIENNITWNYIKVSSSRIDKFLNLSSRIINSVKGKIDSQSTIFVDVLNRALLKTAVSIAEKYRCKVVGICTDNPYNISYVDKKYGDTILSLASKLDGYIVLTDKLLSLFNKNNKPSLKIDGITENTNYESDIKIDGDYIFFGGSLMRKYGVYNLIDAYKNLNNKGLKLVICGHHEENDFRPYIEDISNIVYLGALSYQDINYVQRHALLTVNPRPIDPQIDEYSMPSKTLEYLSNGVPTICVHNDLLMEKYKDAIIWAKSGDVCDLENAINYALNLNDKEKEKITSLGKELVEKYTSLKNVSKQIKTLNVFQFHE